MFLAIVYDIVCDSDTTRTVIGLLNRQDVGQSPKIDLNQIKIVTQK